MRRLSNGKVIDFRGALCTVIFRPELQDLNRLTGPFLNPSISYSNAKSVQFRMVASGIPIESLIKLQAGSDSKEQ